VSVKWKTVDKSAISGRDYVGGEGELIFKHNEVRIHTIFRRIAHAVTKNIPRI
jgi:hypothetical protein